MVYVKSEVVKRSKNIIKGYFCLSDKSKTSFEIRRNDYWYQWGNTADNLCLTVNRVEKLEKELYNY
jgi:hypothetical protein